MDRDEFLRLMGFPHEWTTLEMVPPELSELQLERYEVGHEEASEHDRNGAFHWWLKKEPDQPTLLKLVRLSFLDPDQIMAADVRRYILNAKHADQNVKAAIEACLGGLSI